MANFSYKTTTTTTLKVCGTLDVSKMTIDIDGEEKFIKDLLADFNGGAITLTCGIRTDEDLSEDGE